MSADRAENINHAPVASGTNPSVPKDSVQDEIEGLADRQPKWRTHQKQNGKKK